MRAWFFFENPGFLMKTPVLGKKPVFRNVPSEKIRKVQDPRGEGEEGEKRKG